MGGFDARPPLKVGIRRILTGRHYVPDTVLCWVDANFKDTTQFLDGGSGTKL